MWPAVPIGAVKCGIRPTLWVSHIAIIFNISVIPPTLGNETLYEVEVALLDERAEVGAHAPLLAGRAEVLADE